jgi:epoxyqueuosine reductase
VTLTALALTQAVKARALEAGFDWVAVGPAGPAEHAGRFEAWLDAGYAGGMDYLARTRRERGDPEALLPGCRAVVAVALAYGPRDDDPSWAGVSRYARGADYHDLMRPRLAAIADYLGQAGGPGVLSRLAVDTSAVLERDLAARAGLGWIGKNTNLIAPGGGSYFFIGIVLTTAALVPDGPMADHCGSCTACLDACPTGAFVGPWVLDARRCLAYLTIEHRGDVPDELKPAMGDWLFGCDVCQEVCPWNRKAPPAREPRLAPAAPLPALEALLEMDEAAFRARFRGSAMSRAKRAGLSRNAALLLGNRGDRAADPALERALHDPDEGVRRAAAWALASLSLVQPLHSSRPTAATMRAETARKEPTMADDIKDRENKDAEESGRPVQLDPEEQGGKTGQQDQDMQHDEDTQPEKQGSRSR